MPVFEDTLRPLVDRTSFRVREGERTIIVDHPEYFRSGDVVKIDNELMLIDKPREGPGFRVDRGYGGTIPTDHGAHAPVTIVAAVVGKATVEATARLTTKAAK